MSEAKAAEPGRRVLAVRGGASRKLLARKAAEKPLKLCGAPLESSFPSAEAAQPKSSSKVYPKPLRGVALARQMLRQGEIHPNPNTVLAVIVAIVAERVEVSRSELIDSMHRSRFPHPAARPHEKGWCQGYVAGALRSGFLVIVPEPETSPTEQPAARAS